MVIVVAAALGVAGAMFSAYYAHPDALWRGVYHDRNGHLLTGMNFALAAKTGDPLWFGTQLLAMNVWGPVHGLVLAVVFLVGGVDYRLAILPSLLGWTMTVLFGAMFARALFAGRALGLFAGALTAIWIIASPAFRLLGSDVMLEGLGAGLTALGLWTYQRARADLADAGRWRTLAVALSLLFFEKANYWGLLAVSLPLNEALERRGAWRAGIACLVDRARSWRWVPLADPLLLAFAIVAALVAWLYLRGASAIELFGRRVSLYPPENLATVAYALLFIRLWLLWRAHLTELRDRLGPSGRGLFYWHVAPVAVSFLIPRRLASFIWFVGPANSHPGEAYDPFGGALLYSRAFVEAYSAAPWAAWLAATLALVGVTQWRRYPIGGRAVFIFVATCAIALCLHPQHQARFLASWVFAVWICAGAGGAVIGYWLARRLSGPALAPLGVGIVALFAVASTDPGPSAAAYEAAIRLTGGPSDLDLVRPWLGAVSGAHVVGVAATFGPSDLFTWAMEERCQCKIIVERPWTLPTATRDQSRQVMLTAISTSNADRWVVIDAPGSTYALPALGYSYDQLVGLVDGMRLQRRFKPIGTWPLAEVGSSATVYAPG